MMMGMGMSIFLIETVQAHDDISFDIGFEHKKVKRDSIPYGKRPNATPLSGKK